MGFSQMRERLNSTDLERYKLTGKVKQLIHKEYEPRFTNDSTYTLKLYDFLAAHNYKLEFNLHGNLIGRTELRKVNDSLKTGAVWYFKYDNNNRILQEKRISLQYSKDTIIWNFEYRGDSIVNVNQFDNTYKILYNTYKQKGNIEYLKHANSDSSYITKKRFVYDKQNRLTRYEDYANKDFIQDLKIYSYVDNYSKNINKTFSLDAKYNNSWINEYRYNFQGDVISISFENLVNDNKPGSSYQYIYDENGNWVEKKQYNPKGRLSVVFRREIVYYK